jgi:hypothetical protein
MAESINSDTYSTGKYFKALKRNNKLFVVSILLHRFFFVQTYHAWSLFISKLFQLAQQVIGGLSSYTLYHSCETISSNCALCDFYLVIVRLCLGFLG